MKAKINMTIILAGFILWEGMIYNMNTLLLFFAFPVATIILAIVLEKIIRNPILTAATFFAVFLVIAFAFFDATFLVYVIAYTILAFIAAVIAEFFFRRCRNWNNRIGNLGISEDNNERGNNRINNINNNCDCNNNNSNSNCCNNNSNNNSNCNCQPETVTANIMNNNTGRRSTWCCYRRQ